MSPMHAKPEISVTHLAAIELDTGDDGRIVLEASKLEALLTEAYRKGYADAHAGETMSDETVRLLEIPE